MNLRRSRLKYTPSGWEGMPDSAPEWSGTLVATWPVPDPQSFMRGSLVAAVLGWTTRMVLRRKPAAWYELVLTPDRLRISSGAPGTQPAEMSRDSADWLIARQEAVDWHSASLLLADSGGNRIVFPGRWAEVRRANPGEPPTPILASVPVAVLVGSWWPHPARRQTQTLSFLPSLWQSPDLTGFPAWERHQRLVFSFWLALFGALLLLTWVAYAHSTVIERLAATTGGIIGLSSAFALIRWRPRYD